MANLNPRRAEAGTRFTYTQPDGTPRNLKADDEGVVKPKDLYDEQYLDSLDLPVARAAMKEATASDPDPAPAPVVEPEPTEQEG